VAVTENKPTWRR